MKLSLHNILPHLKCEFLRRKAKHTLNKMKCFQGEVKKECFLNLGWDFYIFILLNILVIILYFWCDANLKFEFNYIKNPVDLV